MSSWTLLRCRSLLVAAGLAGAVLVGLAGPAGAHAGLVDSDPVAGEVLSTAPRAVVLVFNEAIEVPEGGVELLDTSAEPVRLGRVTSDGATVRARITEPLADGGYVLVWRAVSRDGHPVDGVISFRVGAAGDRADLDRLAGRLLGERGVDSGVRAVYGIARFCVFASFPLLLGAPLLAAWCWPTARRRRGVHRLVIGGWTLAMVGTLVGLAMYGPYVSGGSFGDAFDPGLLADSLDDRAGTAALVRLGLLLVALGLLVTLIRRWRTDQPLGLVWRALAGLVATGLVLTLGIGGHASSGDLAAAAVVADALHVAAMSVWLGGLALLAVLLRGDTDPAALALGVDRFRRVAVACVGALLVTGAFQSWRQLRSFDALGDTDYGRTLVVKLVIVAVVLLVAGWWGTRRPAPSGTRGLRWAVLVQASLLGAVLVVSTVLVDSVPPRRAAEALAGVDATATTHGLRSGISVDPGRVGANDVEILIVDSDGDPVNLRRVDVTLTPPGGRAGELYLPLGDLGGGRYVAPRFWIPVAGEWTVTVRVMVRGEPGPPAARTAVTTISIG